MYIRRKGSARIQLGHLHILRKAAKIMGFNQILAALFITLYLSFSGKRAML
jgi:hypothetical protein